MKTLEKQYIAEVLNGFTLQMADYKISASKEAAAIAFRLMWRMLMGLMKVHTAVSPILGSLKSNNVYTYTVSVLPSTTRQCIVSVDSTLSYIIGRLAFASCPHSSGGCTENVTASVGTVRLNATLYYIPGGRCGFQQTMGFDVTLKNLTSNRIVFMSDTSFGEDEVNVTMGESGLEVVLTLNVHKSGQYHYEAIIEVQDPGSGGFIELRKKFHIIIIPYLGRLKFQWLKYPNGSTKCVCMIIFRYQNMWKWHYYADTPSRMFCSGDVNSNHGGSISDVQYFSGTCWDTRSNCGSARSKHGSN